VSLAVEELRVLFDSAWNLGVIDIVLVLRDSLICRVFTYTPFTEGGDCYDTSPVILHSWESGRPPVLNLSIVYFPEYKISNLHGCDLTSNFYRASIATLWDPVTELLSVGLNANLQDHRYRHGDDVRTLSGLIVTHVELRAGMTEFVYVPYFTVTSQLVLAVPNYLKSFQWFRIVNELSPAVWCGALLSFTASVITFFFYLKSRLGCVDVVVFTFQSCLNGPRPPNDMRWDLRMFFFIWLLFCFTLLSTYLCTFLSELTAPSTAYSINTLSDFLQSGIVIRVTLKSKNVSSITRIFENPRYEPLKKHVRYLDESDSDLVDVNRNDLAYFETNPAIGSKISYMPYHILADEVLSKGTFSPILLLRPSPYKRVFWRASLRSASVGAQDDWERRTKKYNDRVAFHLKLRQKTDETLSKPLSLQSFEAVFMMWFIGCCVSCCAFLFEYFSCCARN